MNRISDDDRLTFTAETAYTGWTFRRQNGLLGVVAATVASGAVGTLHTCGVFDVAKVSGLAILEGADLFWDEVNEEATSRPVGYRIGVATVAAASGDTTVRCMLGEKAEYAERMTVSGEYDFAVHGGVVGTITFGPDLPVGYYIESAHYNVKTVPASGGSATIALGFESIGAATVKAATAFDDAAYSSTGLKTAAGPTPTTPSTWLEISEAGKQFSLTIATAALTAGKIVVAADLRRAAV